MSHYKTALCYQAQDPDDCCEQSTSHSHFSSSFPNTTEFYTWLQHQVAVIKAANNGHQQFYTRKQLEILDLIEADVINFLYELREEFHLDYNLADFLDRIILPNITTIKPDDIDEEEDHGHFDE
jgi:hypothetical protein